MHYGILVIVDKDEDMDDPPSREDIMGPVEEAMRRYKDAEWDWYQIGGRWTGHFDGYEPEKDPANIKTCTYCGGTGDRATFRNEPKADQHPTGCNVCQGTGKETEWPTRWAAHDGDVIPVSALTAEHLEKVYAVIAGGSWHGGENYTPWKAEKFEDVPLPPLDYLKDAHKDGYAVIVDAHN